MNQTVEKFGSYVTKLVPDHPKIAGGMLAAAYSLVGLQASHFPSKERTSSREYLQGYTARLMAHMLTDASDGAVVNIFMPAEIFHALDIPIVAPEALAAYITCTAAEQPFLNRADEAGVSETMCSYHRNLIGAAETGVLKKPMMIANTTLACDANQLTFRYLEQLWHIPRVTIDVPWDISDDAVTYVAEQLKGLMKTAQEVSGRKADAGRLQECIRRSSETIKNYRRYLRHRGEVHFPEAMTPELLDAINNHLYLGTQQAVEFTRRLLRDLESAPRHTTEKQVLWMHIMPNWQEPLMHILQGRDNHTVEIIECDLAYSSLCEMNPDRPFESMARRLVCDSYNGPGSRRIGATLRLAQKLRVDGIIIFAQWGCKQTQGIALKAKQVFEENGFPALVLDGDGCDRTKGGSEQILTRTNAFVEQLQSR